MNNTILRQCTIKKQERSKLIEAIEDIISFEQRKQKTTDISFSQDLCEADQLEIISALLDALDDPYEWQVESDFRDTTLKRFTALLGFNSQENLENYIEAIKQQALTYFAKQLDALFELLIEENSPDLSYMEQYGKNPEIVNGVDFRR